MLLPKVVRVRSPVPPAEVLARARTLVEGRPGAPAAEAPRPCLGSVDGEGFVLLLAGPQGRPGPVRMTGRVTAEGAGAELRLSFRPAAGPLGALLVLALAGAASVWRLRGAEGPPTAGQLAFLALLGLAFLGTTFRLGFEKARLLRVAALLSVEVPAGRAPR